jgi:hypothetical protein
MKVITVTEDPPCLGLVVQPQHVCWLLEDRMKWSNSFFRLHFHMALKKIEIFDLFGWHWILIYFRRTSPTSVKMTFLTGWTRNKFCPKCQPTYFNTNRLAFFFIFDLFQEISLFSTWLNLIKLLGAHFKRLSQSN